MRTGLAARDGYALAASVFEPSGGAHSTVLVAPAMATTQRFYRPFAEWLAAHGHRVVTLDLRGIGASAPPRLRGFQASVDDWIRLDLAAAVDFAAGLAGGGPLLWLGHSLGGQVLPLLPNAARVTRMVMVASGSGYWRLHSTPMKLQAALLWFVVAPAAIAASDYFPGRALHLLGDMPAAAMRQWRRWCLHPRYAASEPGGEQAYAACTTPVTSLSFTDDEFMSARNTAALHALYSAAPLAHTRLTPADAGVARIGHFGFFRPAASDTLWPRLLALIGG